MRKILEPTGLWVIRCEVILMILFIPVAIMTIVAESYIALGCLFAILMVSVLTISADKSFEIEELREELQEYKDLCKEIEEQRAKTEQISEEVEELGAPHRFSNTSSKWKERKGKAPLEDSSPRRHKPRRSPLAGYFLWFIARFLYSSSAARAACCWAACLLGPVPSPISSSPTYAPSVNTLSWSGPSSAITL